jgi:hypothetical protein
LMGLNDPLLNSWAHVSSGAAIQFGPFFFFLFFLLVVHTAQCIRTDLDPITRRVSNISHSGPKLESIPKLSYLYMNGRK